MEKPELNPVISVCPIPAISQYLHRVHVDATKDTEPIPGDEQCGLRPGIKGSLWGPLLTFSLQDPV